MEKFSIFDVNLREPDTAKEPEVTAEDENEEGRFTPRQWALKRFLEKETENPYYNNTYFSIEYVVEHCLMPDGSPAYKLNTNPRNHDKCFALSADVRTINWSIREGYKIIIKDQKGGIKYCSDIKEFENWRDAEKEKLERKYQYLNNLKWKVKRDETVPFINSNGRVLNENEQHPIECFTKK